MTSPIASSEPMCAPQRKQRLRPPRPLAHIARVAPYLLAGSLCACTIGKVPDKGAVVPPPEGGIDLFAISQATPAAALTPDEVLHCPDAQGRGATPGPLRVQFFGVATLLVTDGVNSIMVDGFLSRPSFGQTLFAELKPDGQAIRKALARGNVRCVDAIVVSHAHFDHALDAAWIAKHGQPRATVYGSASTRMIAEGQGLKEGFEVLDVARPIQKGAFTIQAIPTPHSEPDYYPGIIDSELKSPARAKEMRTGASYSFRITHVGVGGRTSTLLVVPGAPARMEQMTELKCVDVAFLGIARLGMRDEDETEANWRRWVSDTGAGLVIPIHWDNFWQPLGPPGQQLDPMPYPIDLVKVTTDRLGTLGAREGRGVKYLLPYSTYELRGVNQKGQPGCPQVQGALK